MGGGISLTLVLFVMSALGPPLTSGLHAGGSKALRPDGTFLSVTSPTVLFPTPGSSQTLFLLLSSYLPWLA